ncbi:GTPase IMAP family member 4-like protein [Lates japonicus]|uniref:GTPase IMAP family member 4-like protein n=1 Tax=Lates japonicus TaxID=270547 RepID=A0AAD3R161_LATJO|nr:GTPase IMAP family member 4-like protein [Lates japonicus]
MGSWSTPGHVASKELRVLLVGPRRTGKSSSGNTLLGYGRVFDTRGGGTSTSASSVTAGRHVTVVDAQGWGLSEESVPREEKIELLRALDLCGPEGPHVILLVIPLLDFTEPERRVVERRMEILTSGVWRHTMVLFTFGDWLRGQGRSVQERIQSAGPPLQWLMDKCRYRYHVLDNKAAVIGQNGRLKQKVSGGGKKQKGTWQRKDDKGMGRKNMEGEAGGRKEGEQVRELLSKVEDMLQENGAWHFSLHMYQRLEEEWSHREQQLRARLEAETDVGSVRRKQKRVETKINMELEEEQRLDTEEEEQEGSLRKEQEKKEECVERKMKREEEERVRVELGRQSSEEDGGGVQAVIVEERRRTRGE